MGGRFGSPQAYRRRRYRGATVNLRSRLETLLALVLLAALPSPAEHRVLSVHSALTQSPRLLLSLTLASGGRALPHFGQCSLPSLSRDIVPGVDAHQAGAIDLAVDCLDRLPQRLGGDEDGEPLLVGVRG